MPVPARKPLANVAQSRIPFSMKLKPTEIDAVRERAAAKGIGATTLAREYLLTGMMMDDAQELLKGHTRVTA